MLVVLPPGHNLSPKLIDKFKDETPRAKTQSRSAAPYDGQAEDTPTRPTDPSYILRPASLISNASPKRSEMSSTTTKSSKQSSRSRSPQKSLAATERSTVPISLGHVLIGKNHMDTKTLMRDVYDLFRGRKDSIPRELETRVEEADLLLLQDEETDSNLVEPEVDAQTPESQFSDAYKICKITRECIEENVPEARWNGDVHYRLLRLALEGQWQSKGIWFGDITRAQITQKSLIPLMDKKLVELKMVDLAMMIKSDKKLKNRIIARLNRQLGEDSSKYQDCTPSINCTTADYLRYRPIAVSIETKKETDVTDPNLQIGVWSRAHLLKLRQLMPTDVPPPVMPVLSAVGSRWRMTFAQLQLDNQSATVAEIVQGKAGAELVLGTPWLEIGASTSVKGVFQIVATLQRLAQWIHEEYKPWFEKNVFQDQI